MKKLLVIVTSIIAGIFILPALFAFAIGAGATVLAVVTQPKIMLVVLAVFLIVSIPGILLGLLIKK